MKAIRNIEGIPAILKKEDAQWLKKVYDETGIIVAFRSKDAILVGKCGYIDLDNDAEYSVSGGVDTTQYCDIRTTNDLVEYVRAMDSYHKYLVDDSLGTFNKSDLFWAAIEQIIFAKDNQVHKDGKVYRDWGLNRISTYYSEPDNEEKIVLDMDLIEYDSTEIWISKRGTMSINEALDVICNEINAITADMKDIPQYSVRSNRSYHVPNSYEEMLSLLQTDGVFGWLGFGG